MTEIRRVLLIQPPAFCNNERADMNPNAPLGIAYIAAVLEEGGYDVRILDTFIEGWEQEIRINDDMIRVGLSYEEIKRIIADYDPDVVGITSMFTMQRKNAHRVAEIAKEVDPTTFVIMGGAHPTSAPEMVLGDGNVDAIVMGEGDNSIIPLLEAMARGEDLATLDGIGHVAADGGMVVNEKTVQIEDLDTIPFPARHLLPMEKYFQARVRHGGASQRDRATSMITSRGCQYRCNFCTAYKVFTRIPRLRSVENILAEIDHLVESYGVNELFFEDDQFFAKVHHTEALLDGMIERNYDLLFDTPNGISSWLLETGVHLLDKMKRAGCYRINLAIESGNQEVLDNIINKPVRVDRVPPLVHRIREHGMDVVTFIVAGNIGHESVETIDQIRDSFRLCRKMKINPHVSYLTPYPGSEVLEIAQSDGYLIPDFSWDNLAISKQNLTTPNWTPVELHRVVEREMLLTRYSINPAEVFKAVGRNLQNPGYVLRRGLDVGKAFFFGFRLRSRNGSSDTEKDKTLKEEVEAHAAD